MKNLILIGCLIGTGLLGVVAFAAPPYKREKTNCLVILDSADDQVIREAGKYIKENKGEIPITTNAGVLQCYIPQDIAPGLIGKHHIVSIHYNFVDPSIVEGLGEKAVYAVMAWNKSLDVLPSTILLSPADKTVLSTLTATSTISFSWKSLCAGKSRIQIGTSSDFINPLIESFGDSSYSTYTFSVIYLAPNTWYYWRVQAIDKGPRQELDKLSAWTKPFRFKVSGIEVGNGSPPLTPQPLSPEEGTKIPSFAPRVDWADVPSAIGYRVQISMSPLFDPAGIDWIMYCPRFTASVGGIYMYTKYYWRISSFNEAGCSDWSPVWSFYVTEPRRKPGPKPGEPGYRPGVKY